jgi:hypothetical protein
MQGEKVSILRKDEAKNHPARKNEKIGEPCWY